MIVVVASASQQAASLGAIERFEIPVGTGLDFGFEPYLASAFVVVPYSFVAVVGFETVAVCCLPALFGFR